MTYAKALPAASRPLTGRSGAQLVAAYRVRQRRKKSGVCAAVFLGPSELNNADILGQISALDPAIALVIRDYGRGHTHLVETLVKTARMQRRIVFTSDVLNPKVDKHCPRWRRPTAKARRHTRLSMSVHCAAEAIRARRAKADLVFISPVFQTQTHPGKAALRPFQARRLARMSKTAAFALGGVNASTVLGITKPFDGFAAITSLLKET